MTNVKWLGILGKNYKEEREKRCIMGKKLNTNDEQTLYKAETLLYNELAVVYGIEPEKAKNLLVF